MNEKQSDSTNASKLFKASKPKYKMAAAAQSEMIEVILNDRLGKKIRVKCNTDDTIGDLKKLVAVQTGTRPEKIRLQKWYIVYKVLMIRSTFSIDVKRDQSTMLHRD